jgi:hypothetical protein
LFSSQAWKQPNARLQFLAVHHGAGLLTAEVGSGKSTAARSFTAALNPNSHACRHCHLLVSPLDLIPDSIPVLGLIDDAAVVAYVAKATSP